MEFTRVKNFIDGEFVEETGVEYLTIYNPSTGEQIGELPLSSTETAQKAIDSSYEAYLSWKNLPIAERVSYLFNLRQKMIDKREDLAVAIATDQAKHISEARGEVQRVIELLETACSIPTLIQGETLEGISGNINGRVIKQPLGVFGGVAPFNFPALVFGWFIPFAIGTGNTFIFKPSEQSPLFMQKMGEIFQAIGLPKGVVNIVNGDRAVADTWYDSPKMAGVCLVGSTATAKKMAEACGRSGKRSMLLGGAKNVLLAMEDCNHELFISNFINSCYGSAGQRCLAGSIVAVVDEIYDELLEKMVEAAKNLTFGDAMEPDVYMGPVISAQAKARIEDYIQIGIDQGSRLALDGRNPQMPEKNENGYFVGPTIFADVTPCRRIAQEEIFGPVVSVMKVSDLDEAIGIINASPFGNGACIFTQNLYYTEKFIQEVKTGMIGVNVGICAPHPYLPFGGIKDSHLGTNKVQGKDGIDFFTQNKIVTVRYAPPAGYVEKVTRRTETTGVRSCVAA